MTNTLRIAALVAALAAAPASAFAGALDADTAASTAQTERTYEVDRTITSSIGETGDASTARTDRSGSESLYPTAPVNAANGIWF